MSHEGRFLGIANDEIDLVELPQGLRRALRVATGSYYGGVGMSSPRGAERLSGFRVGHVRHGAAIHHVDVDTRGFADDLKSGLGKLSSQTAGIGLIELATHVSLWPLAALAVVRDRSWDGSFDSTMPSAQPKEPRVV